MLLKEIIKRLNGNIKNSDETIKAYGIAEKLTIDKSTILAEIGQDMQISIDDSFNAVLWHRLKNASFTPYAGRGSTDQQLTTYRIELLCYSKNLAFADYVASQIASDNRLQLLRVNYDKEAIIKAELPEALRNFAIDQYIFAITYDAKAVIDSKCYIKFCW